MQESKLVLLDPSQQILGKNGIFFINPNEIEKLNIYPCEMDMLRDRRNSIS
jgi:hypothetical protein